MSFDKSELFIRYLSSERELAPNAFLEFTYIKVTKYFKSRLSNEIMLSLLAFRAIGFN